MKIWQSRKIRCVFVGQELQRNNIIIHRNEQKEESGLDGLNKASQSKLEYGQNLPMNASCSNEK